MSLRDLQDVLAPYSHGDEALGLVRTALKKLAPEARLQELAESLVTEPLLHSVAEERAGGPIEAFNVLQGDIIRTEAAYRFGERLVGNDSYVIATSSCDLVPGRRTTALLMPVQPKRRADYDDANKLRSDLAALTLFKPKQYFYLPPMFDDDEDVLFNVAWLDPLAMCRNEDVNIAERRASLTLVGWRLFGALARELLIREAPNEAAMRSDPPGLGPAILAQSTNTA